MISVRKIVLFLLLSSIFCGNTALSAQQKTLFRQVVDRFGADAKGIWVHFYKGKVDDSQPVLFCMGNDGETYKGFYTYKGSKDKYFFQGKVTAHQVHWMELNSQGEITGYLQGELNEDNAVLQRMDLSRQFVRDISLERTRYPRAGMEDCSDGLWLKQLKGSLLDKACTVVLQHETEGTIRGVIQFEKSHKSYDLKGKCKDAPCRNIHLHLSNPNGIALGDVLLQSDDEGHYRVSAKVDDNHTRYSDWEVLDSFPVICSIASAGPSGYSYVYPYLNRKHFDRWLGLRFKRWVHQFRAALGNEEKQYLQEVGDRATAWVDIEYIGPKMVSGFITFINPLEEKTQREGFVFSFKNKEPLAIKDLFEDETVAHMALRKEVEKQKNMLLQQADERTADWITQQSFDAWCIREEGLCFSTPFNTIYGDRKIIIPYSVIKHLLSDKRLLKL